MDQGRNRGPLSLAVPRKVPVDPRCSGVRHTFVSSAPQSRRIALRRLFGALAALVIAPPASGRSASAQESTDPVQEWTEPIQASTEPVPESTELVQEWTDPVQDPAPVQESTEPVQESTPVQDSAEPAQEITDPGPGRWQSGWNEVVVSLGVQRLWAYEGEKSVLTTFVSTGTAETPEVATPIGQFRVLVKLPLETMKGTVNGVPYEVADVPYVMYFTNEGHALHGTYWHNNFGTPMSHGCVNLPMDVGEWMYRWAPEGTAVTVIP
jgi:lipoprotein-anchoring transpeptidase ErfK/SrfK